MQLHEAPSILALLCLVLPARVQDEVQGLYGLHHRSEKAYPGYTLLNPLNSTKAVLVDMDGKIVHEWETGTNPGGCFYLLDDGSLLRSAFVANTPRFFGGGKSGRLQRFTWEGELVWDYLMADDFQTFHHDVEPLPNGNFLAIVWEHRFREDAIAIGRDPDQISDKGMWSDAVYELRPLPPDDAEIVWEWHVWDHLIQDLDSDKDNFGSIPDHPELLDINADHRDRPAMTEKQRQEQEEQEKQMRALGYIGEDEDDSSNGSQGNSRGANTLPDWLHTNAVAYHAELDLIALSTPNLNELWVIDHSLSTEDAAWNSGGRFGKGGGLLYRWGNPRNYGEGDVGDRKLFYQHDPKWIGGAEDLRLLVFNNGSGREGEFSSVEELALPFDSEKGFERASGKPFGPAEPSWVHSDKGNFYAAFISGAQRLPNGNTLICEGPKGRVFEVTTEGEVVWDFVNPVGGENRTGDRPPPSSSQASTRPQPSTPPKALFRATRIGLDHPAVQERLLQK